MDEHRVTTALDTHIGVPLKPTGRVEVLGRLSGRRRVWTVEQKLELVAEMERCDNVAAFAREREISTALLYTWRRELRYAMEAAKLPPRDEPMFVPVVGGSPPSSSDSMRISRKLGSDFARSRARVSRHRGQPFRALGQAGQRVLLSQG